VGGVTIERTESLKYFMHFKYIYSKKVIFSLFDIVIWLNFLDAVTTYIGLKFFPTITEKNLFILGHIEGIGLTLTMMIKIIVGIVLMLFLKKYYPFNVKFKLDKIIIFMIYLFVNILLCYAVMSNIIVILIHSQIIP